MEVVVRDGEVEREIELTIGSPTASLDDLLSGLGMASDGTVTIDGRVLARKVDLNQVGLCRGTVIGGETPLPRPSGDLVQLRVVGGTDCGQVIDLVDGDYTLGRDRDCSIVLDDPTLSRHHCEIKVSGALVSIRDHASTSGTRLEEVEVSSEGFTPVELGTVIEVGAHQLTFGFTLFDDQTMAVDPTRYASASGEITFNRPPRLAAPMGPPPVTVPEGPSESQKPTFSWMAIATPVIAGGVMVAVSPTHNPLFALMALMSPLMVIGNWWTGRRRSIKQNRQSKRGFAAASAEFTSRLLEARSLEARRRRSLHPDMTEIARRLALPSVRLWERRGSDADFLQVTVALAPQPWSPPLSNSDPKDLGPDVKSLVDKVAMLPPVPVIVDLAVRGPIGIVGRREQALEVARALVCQIAVLQGPSDVSVMILVDGDRVGDWEWAKWLPHARDLSAGDERYLYAGDERCNAKLRDVLRVSASRDSGSSGGPTLVTVVDSDSLTRTRGAPIREVLKSKKVSATGIVIATSEDLLPAECTAVVDLHGAPGEATVRRPQEGVVLANVLVTGIGEALATGIARQCARYEDPDVKVAGSSLPSTVRVAPLLGLEEFDSTQIADHWREYDGYVNGLYQHDAKAAPGLAGAIGIGEDGPLSLDLVYDGPHGLVGGTTGSGKTELLRSIVLGLAVTASPKYLNFAFIDYKGGAGFETLSRLPHCVGLSTNLSPLMTVRVLDCLQSEIKYRQRCFSQASKSVDQIHEFWQVSSIPMPRLVVVIDEFAELVDALDDGVFMDTIISIGRVGRSVGIHLVLATQRPAGVVKQELKANTNFSVALRVRDRSDSEGIIDAPEAATIPPKSAVGRAYLRVGGKDGPPPVIFQSAFSGYSTSEEKAQVVTVEPFVFGPTPVNRGAQASGRSNPNEASELDRIVRAMSEAFAMTGDAPPRHPWLDPLASSLDVAEINASESIVQPGAAGRPEMIPFAVADDTTHQAQPPVGWQVQRGNLLIYGMVGSGTTTALASIALAIDRDHSPGDAEIYVMDFGSGELSPLETLGCVGAVVTAAELDRHQRLLKFVADEVRARKLSRGASAARPRIFILVDGFASMMMATEQVAGFSDDFYRLFSEGPDVDVYFAIAGERPNAIPFKYSDLTPQKLVFRLSEPGDYVNFGLPKTRPADLGPGRGFFTESRLVVQVARPVSHLADAVAKLARPRPSGLAEPFRIGSLPTSVGPEDLVGLAQVGSALWSVPVGIGDTSLDPVCWNLHVGEHALIVGPPRSGKSSCLVAIARILKAADGSLRCAALIGRSMTPLTSCADVDAVVTSVEELVKFLSLSTDQPTLVLVDDAHAVSDFDGQLDALLSAAGATHVVAAARSDDLRGNFGHWTQSVRKSRTGILLKVQQASDAEFVGTTLPFGRKFDTTPGRGFVVRDGDAELAQIVQATAQ